MFRFIYTPDNPTLVFQISYDSRHRLRSYCWETARRYIRPNFSVHHVGKTMCCIKKMNYTFLMGTTSSITMQSLGKIVQRAPAVGAKMWCFTLFVFFCLSRSESGAPCVWGVHSSNKHCVAVYRPMSTRFTAFFHKWLLFQMHYIVLTFVARWCHNFREIAVKNCKKSKNRRKSLCTPLHIDSWDLRKIPRQ